MAQTICHSMYGCQYILNNWSTCACLQFQCVWILKTITSTYKGSRDQVVKSTIQHFRESRVLLSTSTESAWPIHVSPACLVVWCFVFHSFIDHTLYFQLHPPTCTTGEAADGATGEGLSVTRCWNDLELLWSCNSRVDVLSCVCPL